MELITVDSHITAIDHNLLGLPGVGACYVVQGESVALIETGTAVSAAATLAGLAQLGIAPEAVEHILCTHIHVDHTGGAGHLAAALPRANIYINSHMAPHLAEPTKLMASSRRAIGERAWPLHGDMLPIPLERILPSENLRLDLGRDVVLEAKATPGHSPDHTSFWDRRSGGLFIGDAAALVMDRYGLFFPCTPPPTYDLEAMRTTVATLRQQQPSRLYITHFGPHDDSDAILARTQERLEELVHVVHEAMTAGEEDVPVLNNRWLHYSADNPAALVAESWGEMSIAGMLRYEKKRQQA
ncbi:MAG: MBL fold metallo-hydrolase [Chloroflexaceae bacterium]|nr:MBL fold metallo-hydrolase [Chloroflexaceae bacterium]